MNMNTEIKMAQTYLSRLLNRLEYNRHLYEEHLDDTLIENHLEDTIDAIDTVMEQLLELKRLYGFLIEMELMN